MKAKIYKPNKTAMQSGRAKYNKWVLKFLDQKNQLKDTMMGWNGGSSTVSQIELKFSSKEEVLIGKINLSEAETLRNVWGVFRDRRPELYKGLLNLDGSE